MNLKEIKQTLNSEAGKSLKEYLQLQLNGLKSLEGIKEKDTPTHQAIELKAQLRAYEKLKDILDKIMDIEEMTEAKPEKDQFFA